MLDEISDFRYVITIVSVDACEVYFERWSRGVCAKPISATVRVEYSRVENVKSLSSPRNLIVFT